MVIEKTEKQLVTDQKMVVFNRFSFPNQGNHTVAKSVYRIQLDYNFIVLINYNGIIPVST